ncbi:MAG TPA: hypothetical protein PLA50_03420 [Bacteroidia bacterium]|nr:hypothetical protein [Bacteroidia bacterium]
MTPPPKPAKKKLPSKRPPAEKSALSIPAPAGLDKGDPRFAAARKHAHVARMSAALFIGANVALGAELRKLRATHSVQRGGDRKSKCYNVALCSDAPTWVDLVKTQSGCGWETARRCEKVADDILLRLEGKRDKASAAARRLVSDPSKIASADDYAVLASVAGALYDADTWTGILVEAGIVRPSIAQLAAGKPRSLPDKGKPIPLAEEARLVACSYLERLREPLAHHEKWRQRLAALPLDPTGDPKSPSLSDLRAEISDRLNELDEIILRKRSAS